MPSRVTGGRNATTAQWTDERAGENQQAVALLPWRCRREDAKISVTSQIASIFGLLSASSGQLPTRLPECSVHGAGELLRSPPSPSRIGRFRFTSSMANAPTKT
jgi:hypothetical protein